MTAVPDRRSPEALDPFAARPAPVWPGTDAAVVPAPRPDPRFTRGAIIGVLLMLPFWSLVAFVVWRLLRR